MMSKKLSSIMDAAKVGAWIAFGCLSILILIFPFVGIALAIDSLFNPDPFNAYIGLGVACAIYLALYFIFRLIVAIYPWWRSRKIIPRTIMAVTSLLLVIAITTVSIVVPQQKNYKKITAHFETNWSLSLPDNKLKYSKIKFFGWADGFDELTYAVFKLKDNSLNSELLHFMPNDICNLDSWLESRTRTNPNPNDKAHAKLYFEQLVNDYVMKVPKRFIPDWNDSKLLWGLHGDIVANRNHIETYGFLFVIYTPSNGRLTLFEFLVGPP